MDPHGHLRAAPHACRVASLHADLHFPDPRTNEKLKTELSNSPTSRSPEKVSELPKSQNPVFNQTPRLQVPRVSGHVLGFCAVTPRVEGRFAPCGPFGRGRVGTNPRSATPFDPPIMSEGVMDL